MMLFLTLLWLATAGATPDGSLAVFLPYTVAGSDRSTLTGAAATAANIGFSHTAAVLVAM